MNNKIKEKDLNLEDIINIDKFEIYFNDLIDYNQKVNLTAITEKEEVYIKHFYDSCLANQLIPQNAKVIDVGTGAGFPGLPLKIVRNEFTTVGKYNMPLIKKQEIDLDEIDLWNYTKTKLQDEDNKHKTIHFFTYDWLFENVNQLKQKLNLNYSTYHSRAEDFCNNKTNREKFDVCVSRAVAKLNTLAEYCLPLVSIGGMFIAYKSGEIENEVNESLNAIKILGGEIKEIKKISLPNNMGERTLIIIKKIKNTPNKYPRNKNLPKLKPL